jgi:hypothetical protein
MGRIGMATRDELVGALTARYIASNRGERGRILDEFVAVSGLHRKHAMRLLRTGQPPGRCTEACSDSRYHRHCPWPSGCIIQADCVKTRSPLVVAKR